MNRKVFTLELLGAVQLRIVQPFPQGLVSVSVFLVQAFDSTAAAEGIVLQW